MTKRITLDWFLVALVGLQIILFVKGQPSTKTTLAQQAKLQHRVELLEEDVSRLEQRVVKLEDVLVEVLAVQTASPAKGVDAKSTAVATKPPEDPPVSVAVPQDPSVQARPAKRKSVVRHPATQGSEYPQMKRPYPWTEWESAAPQQE